MTLVHSLSLWWTNWSASNQPNDDLRHHDAHVTSLQRPLAGTEHMLFLKDSAIFSLDLMFAYDMFIHKSNSIQYSVQYSILHRMYLSGTALQHPWTQFKKFMGSYVLRSIRVSKMAQMASNAENVFIWWRHHVHTHCQRTDRRTMPHHNTSV